MIYKEINENTFAYELSKNKDNGFTYNGAIALYDYLDQTGEDIAFDPVALRCEFSEITKEELLEEYSYLIDEEDYENEEEKEKAIFEEIEDDNILIEVDENTFIISY